MKQMNSPRFVAWALLVAMPLWFGSCKKDSSEAVTPASVQGNWRLTGMKFNPAVYIDGFGTDKIDDYYKLLTDNGAGPCLQGFTVSLNNNGSTALSLPKSCEDYVFGLLVFAPFYGDGKWTVEGDKLIITDPDGTTDTYDVAVTGNTMKLSFKGVGEDAAGKDVDTKLQMTLKRI